MISFDHSFQDFYYSPASSMAYNILDGPSSGDFVDQLNARNGSTFLRSEFQVPGFGELVAARAYAADLKDPLGGAFIAQLNLTAGSALFQVAPFRCKANYKTNAGRVRILLFAFISILIMYLYSIILSIMFLMICSVFGETRCSISTLTTTYMTL